MGSYQTLDYCASELAEKDPFEIGEIEVLSGMDIGRYYGSIVNSMMHTTLVNWPGFRDVAYGADSRYFFENESLPVGRLITGNSAHSDIEAGSNRILVISSEKMLIRSLSDLIDSFYRINLAGGFEDGEFGEDWSIDLRNDLIDYQFSDSGDYFRFNFHHPDEQRVVSKRLL